MESERLLDSHEAMPHDAAGAPPPAAAAVSHTTPLQVSPPDAFDVEEEEEEDAGYTVDHLSAVIRPVALTMILAAIAVSKIRDPQQDAAISNGLSVYLVYNEGGGSGGGGGGDSSTGSLIGEALINAIVIVCVIAAATFVLVACYYFRCLKLMLAYLIFACVNLLGYSGGFMVISAVTVYGVILDYVTLALVMANFALGGAVAVFWQKGCPRWITQGYLVAVSVIMAWILTKLPEWTSWALLVALAVYDLCAVLTPCGPLKWLVQLAQTRQDPIPGLLYEANVGPERGDAAGVHDTFSSGAGAAARRPAGAGPAATAAAAQSSPLDAAHAVASARERIAVLRSGADASSGGGGGARGKQDGAPAAGAAAPPVVVTVEPWPPRSLPTAGRIEAGMWPTRSPVAVTLAAPPRAGGGHGTAHAGGSDDETAAAVAAVAATAGASGASDVGGVPPDVLAAIAAEDASLARAAAPHGGGPGGRDHGDSVGDTFDGGERSIKLGLGDFVFYSVLVSRAALFDVSTFAASFVSVILGLGGTLFLLGVFKKALPALPISIALGVAAYFLTRLVAAPMMLDLALAGVAL